MPVCRAIIGHLVFGNYYPAARHLDTRKYICCHIPFLIIVNLENI
jgi:hypothetical protein